MPINIKTGYESVKRIHGMVYGMPGVGKTIFTASAPTPLIADSERGGVKSLSQFPELADVAWFNLQSIGDLDEFILGYRQGKYPYETFVVDSISEIERTNLNFIAKQDNREINQQQDYNKSTNQLRRRFLELHDLPIHLIFTAHAIVDKDEVKGIDMIRPAMTPSLFGSIMGMVDVLAYLEIDHTGKRTLTTRPTRRIQAKDRLGLPNQIINPTFNDLLNPKESHGNNLEHGGRKLVTSTGRDIPRSDS